MKKIYVLLLAVLAFATTNAQTNVGTGQTYTTLKAAFDAINSGTLTGAITLNIVSNTTETAPAVLNASGAGSASYTSVTINPSGGAARTISGAITAGSPLIDLNGADNVTINGLNTGGNSLTISNTTASGTAGTSTIRFIADATTNTITNCTVLGSSTMATTTLGGTIFFSTGTTGNDNNTISNSNIGPAGATLPTKAIFSLGTSTAASNYNNNISITGCNVYDYFNAAAQSNGIYVGAGNTDWIISNNKFYQTATRTQTTGAIHSAIQLASANINNCTISSNTIGYANNAGTGTYNFAGVSSSSRFLPIFLSAHGVTTATNITGNTITAIVMSAAFSGTSTSSPFVGIFCNSSTGLMNTDNNTIGSLSTTGAITLTTTSASAYEAFGIFNFASNPSTNNNNKIGGIIAGTTNATPAGVSVIALKIWSAVANTGTITNNTIGGTVANSIQSTSTAAASQVIGINAQAVLANPISGNTIQNLTTAGGTGTGSTASIIGLLLNAGATFPVFNNTFSTFTATGAGANVIGIVSILATTIDIYSNTISGLTASGTGSPFVAGIQTTIGTTYNIYKNKIYNLSATGSISTTSPAVAGMALATTTTGSTQNVYNNLIGGLTAPAASLTDAIRGISITGSSTTSTYKLYYNTIQIGASSSGTNFGTTGVFHTTSATATTAALDMRNNIIVNTSTPAGTGLVVAYRRSSATLTNYASTSNNNLLYAGTPSASRLIFYDGTNSDQTISAYKSRVSTRDALSVSDNAPFLSTTGSSSTFLHLDPSIATQAESGGAVISGYTDDYDGDTRNATNPDIGADEYSGTAADATPPVITFTDLTNTAATGNRTFSGVTITDASSVEVTTNIAPRVYYKRSTDANVFNDNSSGTDGWKWVESASSSSPFSFTIDYSKLNGGTGVVAGQTIQYFVVAQDKAPGVNVGISYLSTFAATPSSVDLTSAAFPIGGTIKSYLILQSVSGVLTVPGAYPSLTNTGGVFEYINANEVTGDVTISITGNLSGETGANALNQFASPYTVTIKPAASATPTVTGAVAGALIKLNGADRVTIDGSNSVGGITKDLTITNTSTSASAVINVASSGGAGNGANNVTIKNVNVIGGINTTTGVFGIVSSASTSLTTVAEDNDNLTIQNNSISKVYRGITCLTSSTSGLSLDGLVISGNNIGGTTSADYVNSKGIEVSYATSAAISQNIVSNINAAASITTTVAGIELGAGMVNGSVTKNKITTVQTGSSVGAYGINFTSGTNTSGVLVADNMITDIKAANSTASTANSAFGIRIVGGTNLKLYFNTINLFGNVTAGSTSGTYSADIIVTSSSVTGLEIRNNVLVNTMNFGVAGGFAYNVNLASGTTLGSSNSNDYYGTNGSNTTYKVGIVGTTAYAALSDWQGFTGSDAASIAVAPVFTSSTDVHLQSVTANGGLNNKGAFIASVTTDIDGDVRDGTFPDMGADEFTPPTGIDVGIASVARPTAISCHSASEPLIVNLSNYSGATHNFTSDPVTVTANVSGAITGGPFSTTINTGTLAAGQSLQVNLGNINTTGNGSYTITSSSSLTGDNDNTNNANSTNVVINYTALSVGVAASPSEICQSGTSTITATVAGGTTPYTYVWGTGATTSSITTPTLTNSTSYSITVTDACSVQANNSVNVVVNNPLITGTTPAGRCGPGTVTLGASANSGATVNWYAAATGGSALATGNSYTTPTISSTTTYYVSASKGGGGSSNVASPTIGTSTFITTTVGWGLRFTVNQPVTINSVTINAQNTSAGTANIQITVTDLSDVVLYTGTAYSFSVGTALANYVIPVNITIPTTGNYKMQMTYSGLSNMVRESSGVTFPYSSPGGEISITAGANGSGTAQTTSAYYWFYNWVISTGCENTSRTAVIATVTNPVAINATASLPTICAGGTSTLSVTSTNTNYSYVWAPGAVGGASINVSPGSTTTYTVTADDGTCTNTQNVTITVQPANPSIAASPATICISGTADLSANPSTGYGANTLQWQTSPDNVSFTDIPGATSTTYTTPSISTTTYYKLLVKNSSGTVCASPTRTQVVNSPSVTSTTGATRCGVGTLQLQASGSAGTVLNWYAASTGGVSSGTGQTFNTPTISSTTTYYVGATLGGSSASAGKTTYTASPSNFVGSGVTNAGLVFDALTAFTLQSVVVYAQASTAGTPGTLTIDVVDASNNVLNTATVNVTGQTSGALIGERVNLNFNIAAGTNLKLRLGGRTGVSGVTFDPSANGPYAYPFTVPGVLSINQSTVTAAPANTSNGVYYMFYDWIVTTGCESARTPVVANITTPPAITAIGSLSTICNGTPVNLSVTSPNDPSYNYLWSPGGAGASINVSPTTSTTYTVTATDPGTQCVNQAQVVVNVQPNANNINSSVASICQSGAATLTVNPSTGYTTTGNLLQWQNSTDNVSFNDIAGQNSTSYTTPTLTSTTYYKLLVKNSAGTVCTQPSIAMVVNNPTVTATTPATRCGPGTITLGANGSSGTTLNWYGASSGGSVLGTGASFITPVISANTTYYVAANSGTGSTQTSSNGVPTVSTTTTNVGIVLDINQDLVLTSVDLYATVAGDATIELRNSAGTTIQGPVTITGLTASGLSTPQNVTLNFSIPAGTGYKLLVTTHSATLGYATGSFPASLGNGVGSIVNGATASGTTTLNYYFYNLRTTTGCESARTAVLATVTPAPAITASLTGTNNICPGASTTLGVTSANGNYAYTWTPGSLSGASQTVSPSATTTYTVTANDAGTGCQNSGTVTVNVQPAPTLSSSTEICVSGTALLSANPSSGYAANTLQWQVSSDNVSFTDISGATSTTYTTPTLSATRYYKLIVKNGAGAICSQPTITQVVNNPLVTSSTSASRCGPGTVTLTATPSAGASIKWYAAASGGTALATGTSYSPNITATTTYYVSASKGAGVGSVGAPNNGNTSGYTLDAGLNFDVFAQMTLIGVYIYPVGTGAGTVNIELLNSSNTVIQSLAFNCTGTAAPGIKTFVPLNWVIPAATGYYLGMESRTGLVASLTRDGTADIVGGPFATNPNMTVPGVMTITSGRLTRTPTSTSTSYYFFYDWQITTGCESSRQAVTATVGPAPAITVGHTLDSICPGAATNLSVTSANKNYTYTWTPGTGITGTWVTVRPSVTTKYFVTAFQASTGCQNVDSVTVKVQPAATSITGTLSVCSGGTTTLTVSPSTGYAVNSLQWQSSPNNSSWTDIAGATSASYTTPAVTSGKYYRIQVKNAQGGVCSQPSAFVPVYNPQILSTTPASRCGTGTVTLNATANAGSTISWYSTSSGGTLLGTGNSYTTSSISSTTTYYAVAAAGGVIGNVGKDVLESTASGTGGGLTTYMKFDAVSDFVLQSVVLYPYGATDNVPGTVTIELRTSTGTAIMSQTVNVVAHSSFATSVPQRVNLNFPVPGGASYRLGVNAWTGGVSNLWRDATGTYPYTLPGVVSITGPSTTPYYYFFYDWNVLTGCRSAFTPVVATVTTSSAPTVSIAVTGGTNPTCSGKPVTFTATPTNGGTAPSYQWKLNGANVGTNSPTYTNPGITGGIVSVVLTSNGCVTTPTATSNTITLNIQGNQWTGAVNNDFNNKNNWCSGVVPTAAVDVMIPATAPVMPRLTGTAVVNNVDIASGATIDLNGYSMTINGAVSGAGYFRAFTGYPIANDYVRKSMLVFAKASGSAGTLNMDPSAKGLGVLNMTGAATLTLGNALDLYDSVDVDNATLATSDNLTLKSVQATTGRVGEINGNGDITGNVTVERWLRNVSRKSWRLLAVPTQGAQTFKQAWMENQAALANGNPGYGAILTSSTGVAQGFDAVTTYNSILRWDPPTQAFVAITPTSTPIATRSGYYVYIMGDRSITPSSNVTTTTTLRTSGTLYKGTLSAINPTGGQIRVVGNVYASAIDFTELQKTNLTAFSLWDPALAASSSASATGGALQTFSSTNGWQAVPGGGTYAINPVNTRIESGQAFVISPAINATITFTENAKTSGSRQFLRSNEVIKRVKGNVYLVDDKKTELLDGNVTVFGSSYAPGTDQYDVVKMPNTATEGLGVSNSGLNLVIDARPEITSSDVIYYALTNAQPQKQYMLEFTSENLDPSLTAYLEDSYMKTKTPVALNATQTVQFTVTNAPESRAVNRFRLVFSATPVLTAAFEQAKGIKEAGNAGYIVAPNPVRDGNITVQFTNQPEGKYSIRLYNANGQVVYSKALQHKGANSTNRLSLSSSLPGGLYKLEVVQPDKQHYVQSLVVSNGK